MDHAVEVQRPIDLRLRLGSRASPIPRREVDGHVRSARFRPAELDHGMGRRHGAGCRVADVGVDESAGDLVGNAPPLASMSAITTACTLCCHVPGHALTDPVAATGDERHLAVEVHGRDRVGTQQRSAREPAGREAEWTTLRCWMGRVMAT